MAKKKKERSKANTLGASYRAASSGIILATPAIDAAQSGARSPEAFVNAYRAEAKPFIMGTIVHAVDQAIGQRFVGHNTALGRGSVTAWIGEAVPIALGVAEGVRGGTAFGAGRFTEAKTGYNVRGGFGFNDSLKLYLGTKYGLGLVRKASNISLFRSVFKLVKKMLGAAGGAF